MAETHYCMYDRNIPEPCGKVARFLMDREKDYWLCAEHWDWWVEFCERYNLSLDPDAPKPQRLVVDDDEF